MSLVNTDITINKKAPKKSKKAVVMNPHNKFAKKEEHFEEEQTTNHFNGFIPEELVNNSKSLVIKGASMVAKSKQDVLYQKLASKYVNAYLNNYFMLNMMGQLNDHVKMALVYGVCYLETIFIPVNTPEQTTKANEVI